MTRVDLVDAISPNRLGSDKSKWDPDVLTRSEADEVVNVLFEEIVEALLKGETVDLPIGTFEVLKRKTRTPSGRLRKVEFTPDEWMIVDLNDPAGRPEQTGPPPVLREKKIRKFKPYPREEQLKQMLKVAEKWILERYLRDEVIYTLLPDAKRWVDLNRGTFPEYPLRPAALLLRARPANLNESDGVDRLAAWADWFKSFLADCAPLDHSLREEAVDMLIVWANVTMPLPTGIGPWGPKRVKILYQLRGWRPN